MLQLPNGCQCSKPSVFPKDWKTVKSITCDWKIQYYFYDPNRKKPTTPIIVKGMNGFKNPAERRAVTKVIMEQLLQLLQFEGFNPYTGEKYIIKNAIANTHMGFIEALEFAFEKVKITDETKLDIKSMLKYFTAAASALGITNVPLSEISRRHVKAVLEQAQKMRNLSAHRYNKYRTYLSLLFNELEDDELVDFNFIPKIKKQDVIHRIREQLTAEQCMQVDEHLKNKVYNFWRMMNIFYQSGGRMVELLRVQVKDVNIDRQEYKATIIKGKKKREVIRVINDEILPLWKEVMDLSTNNDQFVFSEGLIPGARMIRRDQITRRWETHVKKDLGVTADFSSLKNLFLDRVDAKYDITTSQQLADHTTPVITMKHYATGHKGRELEKKKKVKVSFAG